MTNNNTTKGNTMKTKEEMKARITEAVENNSREELIDMLADMTLTLSDLRRSISEIMSFKG